MKKTIVETSRLFYSIKEAAAHAGCKSEDLLLSGTQRKLRFCIPIPKHKVVIYAIDWRLLPKVRAVSKDRFYSFGLAASNKIDDLHSLLIGPDDCQEILNMGFVQQEAFDFAYSVIGRDVTLKPEEYQPDTFTLIWDYGPQEHTVPPPPRMTFVACSMEIVNSQTFHVKYLEPIRISEEDIFLTGDELSLFIANNLPNPAKVISLHEGDIDNPWMTLRLRHLIKAHQRFWNVEKCDATTKSVLDNINNLIKFSDSPDDKRAIKKEVEAHEEGIISWLSSIEISKNSKKQKLFDSDTFRRGVVNLIRPDVLRPAPQIKRARPQTVNRFLDCLSQDFHLLIEYVDSLRITKREMAPVPSTDRDEIIMAIKGLGFSGNVAEICAKIIRPESVPLGRRKKNE